MIAIRHQFPSSLTTHRYTMCFPRLPSNGYAGETLTEVSRFVRQMAPRLGSVFNPLSHVPKPALFLVYLADAFGHTPNELPTLCQNTRITLIASRINKYQPLCSPHTISPKLCILQSRSLCSSLRHFSFHPFYSLYVR